ncbi:hypothetical protein CRU92_10945 [Arcobacter sp. FW59]|nr:hypothetical protein CRU92_10945 [Arcobacter sp. FW59]
MSAKKFNIPFATLGDKTEVPVSAQVDGSTSYEQGYPYGYELEYTDPNAKDINRPKLNQILYDITNAIREIQQGGVSEWSEDGKPYKINSLVYAPDGTVKQSLIANNNNATTHSSWSNLINASTLATALSNISSVPEGLISMWSGTIANIPSGWALCNGQNGTPDLRDRFIVGAGSSYNVGVTGGSKDSIVVSHTHTQASHTHTGTVGASGAHTHTLSITSSGAHTHTLSIPIAATSPSSAYPMQGYYNGKTMDITSSSSGAHTHTGTAASSGAHTHTITNNSVAPAIASTGSSGTNANLPPYYALAYIMKL